METMKVFALGEMARAKGNKAKVFDWHKAAQLINERKPKIVFAGLSRDWGNTGGVIYENGKPVPKSETYTYLASIWDTPVIDIDGEIIPCFIDEDDTKWGANTYWPKSALEILNNSETHLVLSFLSDLADEMEDEERW